MQVIQLIGIYAGDVVDMPVPVAQAAVANGRAKPLPGEEWKFPVMATRGSRTIETTMVKPQQETRRRGGWPKGKKRVPR